MVLIQNKVTSQYVASFENDEFLMTSDQTKAVSFADVNTAQMFLNNNAQHKRYVVVHTRTI